MKRTFQFLMLITFSTLLHLSAQVTPAEMVLRMGKGINLGNTLEAPDEGRWAAPAQPYYFHDMVDEGFTSVRIPIRWENHMDTLAPYTVDAAWMDRVEEVIDWALDTGLVVIINSHHDNEWLYEEFPKNLDRWEALWEQIATRFMHKSENLVFEIVNEPYFDLSRHNVDTLHQVVFPIIRESNPTRIVLFTGGGNDTSPRLTNYRVIYHLKIPDDPYVMAYFHYYVPYQYCQLGNGTWGTGQERAQMVHDFQEVKNWSDTTGVPILLGEFATIRTAHRPSLVAWYDLLTETADKFGFSQTTWCNGGKDAMATYFRQPGYWDQELVNIQTRQFAYPDSMVPDAGSLEAEDFDLGGEGIAFRSLDSMNSAGSYRPTEGMEIQALGDTGYALLLEADSEWAEYSFRADSAALFEITIVAQVEVAEGFTRLRFNGNVYTDSLTIAPGAGFQVLKDTLYLEAGVQTCRLSGSTGVLIDRIELQALAMEEDSSNLLVNPDFELGTLGWYTNSCAIEAVESPVQSGRTAVRVFDRKANWASIQQDILDIVLEKGPGYYSTSAFLRNPTDTVINGKVTVRIAVDGEKSWLGQVAPLDPGAWSQVQNQVLIDWEGKLEEAVFYLETASPYAGEFHGDNAALRFDSAYVRPVDPGDTVSVSENLMPDGRLGQNYPNPFRHLTRIPFHIVSEGQYALVVYNIHGVPVRRLTDRSYVPGAYESSVDMADLPSGFYFYRLEGSGISETRRMLKLE